MRVIVAPAEVAPRAIVHPAKPSQPLGAQRHLGLAEADVTTDFRYVLRQINVSEVVRALPTFDFRWAACAVVVAMVQILEWDFHTV